MPGVWEYTTFHSKSGHIDGTGAKNLEIGRVSQCSLMMFLKGLNLSISHPRAVGSVVMLLLIKMEGPSMTPTVNRDTAIPAP